MRQRPHRPAEAVAALLLCAALQSPDAAATGTPAGSAQPSWRFDGRVQVDHSGFDGVYSRRGSWHSASYLRRATLGATLQWAPSWQAELEVEADSQGDVALETAFIRHTPAEGLHWRLGRIDPDFGLEPSSSSAWTFGVERSALWDLAPDVASGLAGLALRLDAHGDRWHASAGAYDKLDHQAFATRVVAWSHGTGSERLQLGASVATTRGLRSDGRIRTRLGVRGVTENDSGRRSTLADAKAGAFGRETALGIELAWQNGPWMLQAEALQRQLRGLGGGSDRTVQGAYMLVAWSPSGGMRRHDAERGRFRGPRATGEGGVWEVFYRHDLLEVRDGRDAALHTVGLSWTARATWRALFNLHQARSQDRNAVGDGQGMAFSARWQASF